MKRILTVAMGLIASFSALWAAPRPIEVTNVEPPCWWTGMKNDTLQIMLTGPEVGRANASLDYPGVEIVDQPALDSPNYKILYLTVAPDAAPGSLDIRLTDGKRRGRVEFPLLARDRDAADYRGFDAADVLYLLMPDRFAKDSDAATEGAKSLEYGVLPDRTDPNGRHGGDMAGIARHLDYIDSLGVTAIWVCPVLENDMPGGSYHGYATTNYYKIDPRFGSNEQWRQLIESAHDRGLKVVMDMIFNHSGSNHPWMKDSPTADWFNHPDGDVLTNFRLTTVHDPYASDYDLDHTVNGWFVPAMPDLNQRNSHLMNYLIQNSIWWIEWSKIDGIRMDTYPYADMNGMAKWARRVLDEYPNFNIVGECWYGNEAGGAFWQRGSKINPTETHLPTVMDFFYIINGREAFGTETGAWAGGLNKVYDHLAQDFLYPDPQRILTFLDNHDSDRFLAEMPENLDSWKQAVAFLLTSRGIPQIYYGTELLMNGSKEGSDGYVRLDMPGGFPGDEVDSFSPEGRTDIQNEAWGFLSKLLHWRRGDAGKIIARGSLKHFMPQNGMYVYTRRLDGRDITVILNGTDEPLTIDMDRYAEVLPLGTTRHDIISGTDITITPQITFAPRQTLIME